MKIAAPVGIILALFFGILAFVPISDLQDQGGAVSGLPAPMVEFISLIPSLWVILTGVIGVLTLIGGFAFLAKWRH